MDSIGQMAIELVDEALDFAGELGIEGYEPDSGATTVDLGVDADGGVETGVLLTRIQTTGLATIQTQIGEVAGTSHPHAELSTDRLILALFYSQKVGWEFTFDGFGGLGSDPARALVDEEEEFHHLGYYDEFDLMVLAVRGIDLPTGEIAEHIAETTGLESSTIFLPTYATDLLVGGAAGATHAAELTAFNLFETGYNPMNVPSINGSTPLTPVSYNGSVAMDRTDDTVAHGGCVRVTANEGFGELGRAISTVGSDYGVSLGRLSKDANWDLGAVDPNMFDPAQIMIDVVDGLMCTLDETSEDVLADSLGPRGTNRSHPHRTPSTDCGASAMSSR